MQSKNELLKDLNKIREEINSLRGQLTGTNREKEVWFSNKDKLSKDIKKTIIDVKQGQKIERKNKFCPKCGEGVFLAQHKDRLSCGTCKYTEFLKK